MAHRAVFSRWPSVGARALALALPWLLAVAPAARAADFNDQFDRQRFQDGLQQEIAFREAAIHVAWGAEPLCDDTTEIEPFVLWSVRGVKSGLSAHQERLFTQATGMDEHWRIVWLDEAVPAQLQLGQRVLAINRRPLPAPGARLEVGAVFRGGATVSIDDDAFWEVMHRARDEANADSSITVTLEGGREVKVGTQTGCAGTVTASAFDDEPTNFLRLDGRRSKIPGNALIVARSRDEWRWLAAFGTYFLASESSILRQRTSDSVASAFRVGQVLALAVPGANTVLAAMESQTQRTILVDGLVGGADLFANEVVMALGGDPSAGLKLSDRLKSLGLRADVVAMSEFRRSNVELHLQALARIDAARRKAERAAEAAEPAEAAGGRAGSTSP